MRSIRFLCAVLAVGWMMAAAASADNVNYRADPDGSQVVPPVDTPASGKAVITLDKDTNELCVDLTFSGLLGDQTAAHIHGPAPRGQNAGVQIGFPLGEFFQCFALSDEQEDMIKAGLTYINIHTTEHGGGEIRGQIEKVAGDPPPVPTASTWGLIALVLAVLCVGGTVLARRQKNAPAA